MKFFPRKYNSYDIEFQDIMPYFNNKIHVYGYNQSIYYCGLPWKIGPPKILQNFANFGHPVSKSWLRLLSKEQGRKYFLKSIHLFGQDKLAINFGDTVWINSA